MNESLLLAMALRKRGTGGGVTSWNDLTDKPFYAEYVETELVSGEYDSRLDTTFGAYYVGPTWPILNEVPKSLTITLDGAEYKDLTTTEVQGLGHLCGNLYFLNSIAGTSFEDTGEPFMAAVSETGITIFVLDTEFTMHSVTVVAPIRVVHPISQDFIQIPTFDLNEMGLPTIPFDGIDVTTDADNTELFDALKKGCVRLKFTLGTYELSAIAYSVYNSSSQSCYCHFATWWSTHVYIQVMHGINNGVVKSEIRAVSKRPAFET